MTDPDVTRALPEAFFHPDADELRFWVAIPDRPAMGASIARRVLHHRFQGQADGSDALAIYAANRRVIEAAVVRRAAGGSIEPVMLREHDLPETAR